MNEEKVKVRILPLKGIGGVGNAGDVVWMSAADAEMYARDGYVEYVAESGMQNAVTVTINVDASASAAEDHAIMKPQTKRAKRK